MKNSKFKIQNWLIAFCILYFAFLIGCNIPSLEKPECTGSRQTLKEFYSYHFASDMKPSKENLQRDGKFLTDELKQNLTAQTVNNTDYFTQTEDYPKAFRVGGCKVVSPQETVFEVLLFWKDDNGSRQKSLNVETVKQNDQWLINKVEGK